MRRLLLIGLMFCCFNSFDGMAQDRFAEAFSRAGNADAEADRLGALRAIRDDRGNDESIRRSAERLIGAIETWNTAQRLDYFGRDIRDDLDFDFGLAPDDPLYPLTRLYRARMLIWVTLETGNIWNDADQRAAFLNKARAELETFHRDFPENRIARMILGEPIPPERTLTAPPNAPAWAAAQREGLERLADIIVWWIENRMQADGQYGGGWGDDCEMWRWWAPVLIGFDDPAKACDTVYHPRAVQPALLLWQRSGEERLTRLFGDWMDTWVDATARAERGKPGGIIPSAIHWPDGAIGGLGEHWWDPRNHSEPTLYQWPSAMTMMTNTLLLAWYKTENGRYLQPIRSMARIRLDALRDPESMDRAEPGTAEWCAGRMPIADAAAKYRLLTGSDEFDELLERERDPYMPFLLHGDREPLTRGLQRNARALRVNFAGYTSEVRYTDRVLRFPGLLKTREMNGGNAPDIDEPDPALLYSTVTGDPGGVGYFPLNRVRWLTPPRDFAALVIETGDDRFAAEVYHFGESPRELSMEIYLLKPGGYRIELLNDSGLVIQNAMMTASASTARTSMTIPPQQCCTIQIKPDTGSLE